MIHDSGDIIVYEEGEKLIYYLINATITAGGYTPITVSLRNTVFVNGKAYVNGEDTTIMLSMGLLGTIYVNDMSGNHINAQYVSGTIIAFHV